MTLENSVLARTTARILALGDWFAGFASALTLGALVALATSATFALGWLFVVVLGAVAFFYAVRARLDARLFDDLASALAAGAAEHDALGALDASLVELRIGKTPAAQRPLGERARSATRLLHRAAILTAAQLALSALLWLYDQSH